MQGWRTRAEVAKQLGMTERTLQRRINEVGIRPARPGRTAMLSDADVTKLMEASRGRSPSKMQRSLDGQTVRPLRIPEHCRPNFRRSSAFWTAAF